MLAAFGMTDAAAPDQFLIGLATLTLLGDAAANTSLLLLVEDAQWLDRPTCDVLTFVARRLESEPIAMLIAIRDGYESPLITAGLPELRLGQRDEASARVLLGQAPDLAPPVRARLLDEAAGNPLALVELPSALVSEQPSGGSPLPAPLPAHRPAGTRVRRTGSELPPTTRTQLLVAAVDDGGNLGEVLSAAAIIDGGDHAIEALKPAISARLVEVDETEAAVPSSAGALGNPSGGEPLGASSGARGIGRGSCRPTRPSSMAPGGIDRGARRGRRRGFGSGGRARAAAWGDRCGRRRAGTCGETHP